MSKSCYSSTKAVALGILVDFRMFWNLGSWHQVTAACCSSWSSRCSSSCWKQPSTLHNVIRNMIHVDTWHYDTLCPSWSFKGCAPVLFKYDTSVAAQCAVADEKWSRESLDVCGAKNLRDAEDEGKTWCLRGSSTQNVLTCQPKMWAVLDAEARFSSSPFWNLFSGSWSEGQSWTNIKQMWASKPRSNFSRS